MFRSAAGGIQKLVKQYNVTISCASPEWDTETVINLMAAAVVQEMAPKKQRTAPKKKAGKNKEEAKSLEVVGK